LVLREERLKEAMPLRVARFVIIRYPVGSYITVALGV